MKLISKEDRCSNVNSFVDRVAQPSRRGLLRCQEDWLFDLPDEHGPHLESLPDYKHEYLQPWQTVMVHLASREDKNALAKLLGQTITDETKYLWFPKPDMKRVSNKRWVCDPPKNPQHPIYIISKGRYGSRLTVKALDAIKVPYRVVIEPQEHEQYASVIGEEKLLILPFSNLGQGSIPARNWVWEHAIREGHSHHWILDDNIRSFQRYQENSKIKVGDGTIFWSAEQMVNQYTNVALAGFNYTAFCQAKTRGDKPAFYTNTRIYSCILIQNSLPHRWRGRYNEDTDLSLRVLKDGLCTIQFHCFLSEKMATMTMKGGNTDELYKDDGRLKMAQSLQEQHPDCVTITEKWGRPQHHVDYSRFTQKLVFKTPRPKIAQPTWSVICTDCETPNQQP